jgi:hypothetical protein
MIWLDIKELETKISTNELSEKDSFNYVLAFLIVSCLSVGTSSSTENYWINLLNVILLILITLWGVKGAYKANLEVDGRDFIKRFFAISWVVGIRLSLITIGLTFLFGIFIALILIISNSEDLGDSPAKDLFFTVFLSVFEVIYYLLVMKSIRRLKPIAE